MRTEKLREIMFYISLQLRQQQQQCRGIPSVTITTGAATMPTDDCRDSGGAAAADTTTAAAAVSAFAFATNR